MHGVWACSDRASSPIWVMCRSVVCLKLLTDEIETMTKPVPHPIRRSRGAARSCGDGEIVIRDTFTFHEGLQGQWRRCVPCSDALTSSHVAGSLRVSDPSPESWMHEFGKHLSTWQSGSRAFEVRSPWEWLSFRPRLLNQKKKGRGCRNRPVKLCAASIENWYIDQGPAVLAV